MKGTSYCTEEHFEMWYRNSRPQGGVRQPIALPKTNVELTTRADANVGLVELFHQKKPFISSDHFGLLPVRPQGQSKSKQHLNMETYSAPLPRTVDHDELRKDNNINQIVSIWRMDREQLLKQQQAKTAESREKKAVALTRCRQDKHRQIHNVGQDTFQTQKLKAYNQMKKKVTETINTVPVCSKVKTKPYEISLSKKQPGLNTPMDLAQLEGHKDLGIIRQKVYDKKGLPDSQVPGVNNETKHTLSQERTTASKTIPTTDQRFPWSETFTPFTQEERKRKLKGIIKKMVERPARSLSVTPSLLGVHRMIKMGAVMAHTDTDETSDGKHTTAPAKEREYFQPAVVQCAYKSSESGHAITLADGHVYKKQLQTVWPLMGSPLQPLAVRKLRWVGLPIADDKEHNMAALPIDQLQYEEIEDWSDGNELLLRLQKAEEDYRYNINDEVEANKAGWTGVPEFPLSPQELEAELYHPILVAEEWRRQMNHKFIPLKQVSEKSLHRILTTSASSEASRLSAIATVIHVRAKFGRPSEYVKLHEAAAAQLGQKLVSEPELIARAIADTLDDIFCCYVSVRRAAAMTLLALGWETKQREKAVGIMNEAIADTSLLDRSFAAIILAHVGEMSWKILKSVVSYWQHAYFKHDLFHSLLALRCLSEHGGLTASAVAESLNNLEHDVRIKTCFTLPFLKCSLTLDVQMRLREILDRDWHSGVRTSAAHALASLGLCGIVHSHITDLIASKQPHKTIEGLRLVLMLRVVSPLILETVLPCLKSELRSVQLAALEVVARLKITNIKFLSLICQMTLDDDSTVRMGAFQALGCIGAESSEVRKSVLSAVALDQDADVRRAAVNVVGLLKFCGPDVHQALWVAFEREDDPTCRNDVIRVLRGTGVDVSELAKHPGRILREAHEARKMILNLANQESDWGNNQLHSSLMTLNHELRFTYTGLQKNI